MPDIHSQPASEEYRENWERAFRPVTPTSKVTLRQLDQEARAGLLNPSHWLAKFYKERGIDYCRNHQEVRNA